MTTQTKSIDVTEKPELLAAAEAVLASGRSVVLKKGRRRLAVLSPAQGRAPEPKAPRRPRRKTGIITDDDPLLDLIGMFTSGVTDVSANKKRYLAEAYATKKE